MIINSDFISSLMRPFEEALERHADDAYERQVWTHCVEMMPALFTSSVITKRMALKLDSKGHHRVVAILNNLERQGRVEIAEYVQEGDVYFPLYRVCGA